MSKDEKPVNDEMTAFEALAHELGVEITVDEVGLYSGEARRLGTIAIDLILSDENNLFPTWEAQKAEIARRYRERSET